MIRRGDSVNKDTRRRQQQSDGGLDVASYRRGTTLNSFKSDEQTQSERKKLKRRRARRQKLIILTSVMVVILVLALALLSQFAGSVAKVVSSNGVELKQADGNRYAKMVDDYFAANAFERFSFIRRNSALLQHVVEQAPEVSDIKISSAGIARAQIEVTLRQPVAMWIDGDKTEFVDSQGVVFNRNYFDIPGIAIEDKSGATLEGGLATSANFLSFVGRTVDVLKNDEKIDVDRVVVPQGSARYVEFYVQGRSYPFKAQITRDSTSQAHDIAVMTRYIDSRGIQPQYVDCRVEGKAYWK